MPDSGRPLCPVAEHGHRQNDPEESPREEQQNGSNLAAHGRHQRGAPKGPGQWYESITQPTPRPLPRTPRRSSAADNGTDNPPVTINSPAPRN